MNSSLLLENPLAKTIRPYLGAVRRRLRSWPARTYRQKEELLKDSSLGAQERELLEKVESRISPGDGMYTGDGGHYFKVGLDAIRCIESAIDAAELSSVTRILDLPCGHGRVLRFLVNRFPKATITASDLDRKGVDFCARIFGAQPVYSQSNLSKVALDAQFDLIWCGSLVTHFDADGLRGLFHFFARHLSPGGFLVFTAHGERAVQRMLNREFDYDIVPECIPPLIASFREDGFGFANYPGQRTYGVSLTAPEWIHGETEKLGLSEVYFREHGWDNHQDVYGFRATALTQRLKEI